MQNRPVWFFCFGDRGHSARCRRHVAGGCSATTTQSRRECPMQRAARNAQRLSGRMPNRASNMPALPFLGKHARYPIVVIVVLFVFAQIVCHAQETTPTPSPNEAEAESVVVSATRFDIPLDQSPSSVSVITSQDIEQKQIQRVSDALREVPGLSVAQTGSPGQLTSVFTRGLRSEHTQVLLDGIPINQGLQGAFNFADFTTADIDRIEVVRGPQSTIYGPRALAGVIQIFTKQGTGTPGAMVAAEGGSYDSFREWGQSDGKIGDFDYSISGSRFDTENARPNNNYRNTAGIADLGWSPNDQLRIGSLFTYSVSDTGNPNTIFDPRPIDHFLTERWLIGPHIDWRPTDWWDHKFIFSYDHERQVNDPNEDGFVGPTRALFERFTLDYQTNIRATHWLTLTAGAFYQSIDAGEERPFISQAFGPQPTFIGDETKQASGFAQLSITPIEDLNFVAGGRFDSFNQFGDIWTYRVAGNYFIRKTGTRVHASIATGFSPPTPQDKIFGMNFALNPEHNEGWDAGIEQHLWKDRLIAGATYFHNRLSNLIGFNGLFETLNLGAARTQGVEFELHARPIHDLEFTATYTYLDAVNTGSADITQL